MALTKLQAAVIEGVLGLIWQSPAKTSSFAAAIGNGYYLNTTTGAITVTLPSSPTIGDSIGIIDYAGTAASNTIILTSSNNIQGSSNDKIVNYTRGALRITYADTTQGWVASAAANEGTSAINPLPPLVVDFLVVAGGGGGGAAPQNNISGGGGGAGGLRASFNNEPSGGGGSSENSLSLATGTYSIKVGLPGAGASTNAYGGDGEDSIFSNITSIGGGGGANYDAAGKAGGSGGGSYIVVGQPAGNNPGLGTNTNNGDATNQGYNGGTVIQGSASGGGGGAGGVGVSSDYTVLQTGNGGDGIQSTISNVSPTPFYAGGGGGGKYNTEAGGPGTGGSGVGGGGGPARGSNGGIAATNTGSGGGGSGDGGSGGSGGSGVIILRYPNNYTAVFSSGVIQVEDNSVTGVKINTITTAGTGSTITFS
jgi:hypothetical protein